MAVSRYYSSTALQSSLTNSITNSTTIIQVGATVGFPASLPYTLAIDYGVASEELVEVTGVAGLNLTVTRAVDSTSAQSHAAGAVVKHVTSARDFTESRNHENATSAVHGVAGALVGTTDVQTLTNKTLTAPTINSGAMSGTFTGAHTYSGAVTLSGGGTLSGTFTGAHTYSGAVTLSGGGTFTGSFAGTHTYTGVITFNGTVNIATGGSMGGTFSGTPTFSGAVTFSGTPSFTNGAALGSGTYSGTPTFSGAPNFNVGANANDRFSYKGALVAGNAAFAVNPASEIFDRVRITTDGVIELGTGGLARDVNLYRGGVNILQTDDTFTSLATSSTTLTPGAGFTVNTANHKKTGDVTSVHGYLNRSGANITTTSATSSNFTDFTLATLPSGFRPPYMINCVWGNGLSSGEATIDTTGEVQIRNGDYNQPIQTGDNIRFTATWVN